MTDYNEQAQQIHQLNHKWWHDADGNRLERNRGELLMLVVSEIAEAMEALRKDAMDDKLTHRKGEEVELADAYIRLMDYAGGFELELDEETVSCRSPLLTDNRAAGLFEITYQITKIIYGPHFYTDEPDEVSNALSLIRDYANHYRLDLEGAVREKLAYNQTRIDHTHEHRAGAGGKKF